MEKSLSEKASHLFCKALYEAEKRKVGSLLVHLEMMLEDYYDNNVIEGFLFQMTERINELTNEEEV